MLIVLNVEFHKYLPFPISWLLHTNKCSTKNLRVSRSTVQYILLQFNFVILFYLFSNKKTFFYFCCLYGVIEIDSWLGTISFSGDKLLMDPLFSINFNEIKDWLSLDTLNTYIINNKLSSFYHFFKTLLHKVLPIILYIKVQLGSVAALVMWIGI